MEVVAKDEVSVAVIHPIDHICFNLIHHFNANNR